MAGFSIKIGANTVQLTKSLAELQRDLVGFKKQLQSATNAQEVIRLNQAIAQTDRQIKGLTGAQNINALGQSVKQLPAGFNQAGFAVGNFSRIVQDAPFALLQGNLIAVSNNIDPLIQSFVQLKQQTGSSGAALKALGSSLVGSGGLLLGFSLVNAAITFFSARSMFAKEKSKELADTIRDSAKVESDAAASMQGQIATVNALASTINNTNNSYNDRKRALEELRQINKSYFGDLQLEDAATGRLTNTVREYSKAIVNAAIQKEFAQEIGKVAKAASDADAELAKSTIRVANAQKELLRARSESRPTGREGTGISYEEAEAQDVLNNALTAQRTAREKVTDLLTEQATLTDRLNKTVSDGLKLKDLDTGKTAKEIDLVKQRIDALKKLQSEAGLTQGQIIELTQLEIRLAERDGIKSGLKEEEIKQQVQAIVDKAFPNERIDARFKLRVIGEVDSTEINRVIPSIEDFNQGQALDISKAIGLDKLNPDQLNAVVKALQDAAAAKNALLDSTGAEKLSGFIVGELTPAFDQFFNTIASGGQNFFKSFTKLIGDIIKKLLTAIATAATLSAILSAFGLSFGGAKGFGAIFGKLSGINAFATGGIVTKATLGVFGEAGPEAVIPLSRLPQLMGQMNNGGGAESLQAIVRGDDLLFVLNRTQRRQGRIF